MAAAVIPCLINDCSGSYSTFTQNIIGVSSLIIFIFLVGYLWFTRR